MRNNKALPRSRAIQAEKLKSGLKETTFLVLNLILSNKNRSNRLMIQQRQCTPTVLGSGFPPLSGMLLYFSGRCLSAEKSMIPDLALLPLDAELDTDPPISW